MHVETKVDETRMVKTEIQNETLSIIIPVYNEAAHIEQVIQSVQRVVLPEFVFKEVIIVDDNSTDGTDKILESFKNVPEIKIFRHTKNQGKTAAILSGISKCSGTIILLQDADLEYKPSEYPKLIAPIVAGGTKVVYGSRWLGSIKKMKFLNRIANRISTLTTNVLLGSKLTDVYCCHKAFRREVLDNLTMTSRKFAFDSELSVKLLQSGFKIEEVPIDYVARTKHDGKKMNWLLALHMYWGLIKYRFKK